MPLEVQVTRGKKNLEIWDGSYWPLNCVYTAALIESAPDKEGIVTGGTIREILEPGQVIDFSWVPIYYLDIPECPLIKKGSQILKQHHEFHKGDGTVIAFAPGDKIHAWRSHK